MRHDAAELATASAIAKRRGRRRSPGATFRIASRALARRRPNLEVIDEAFAGFTRVDAGVAPTDGRPHTKSPALPPELAAGRPAALHGLNR